MSTNGNGRHREPAERTPDATGAALDGRQVAQAVARVKDPVLRYLLAQLVNLCTERIEQLETALEERQGRHPTA